MLLPAFILFSQTSSQREIDLDRMERAAQERGEEDADDYRC